MSLPLFIEKISSKRKLILYFFIPLVSLLMHLHVFNRDLVGFHAWRQTETQLNIENFAKEDFNILNPRINNRGADNGIVRLEFPLMQWLFAIFYKIFGTHIIISRILSFIIGLFSVWGIYHMLHTVFKRVPIALIGAWCFNFSPVFYYYTINPSPDNFALCMGIWGLAFFFRWIDEQKRSSLFMSAVFLGISVLAKLPFIVFLSVPGMYMIMGLIRKTIQLKTTFSIIVVYGLGLLPAAAWYACVISAWPSNDVVVGILSFKKNEVAYVLDIMQANLTSILPEGLVNYGALLFFLTGFGFMIKNKIKRDTRFPIFLAWGISVILYFLFEMKMIERVHDYYLFPFLPPIFFVVAYGAEQLLQVENKALRPIFVVALCILPLTAFLRMDHRWNIQNPGFNPDLYTYKSQLRAAVPDNALCIAGNDESGSIFFYYIHKKGWCFDVDTLSAKNMKLFVSKGAKYLYTDSRKVEQDTGVMNYMDALMLQEGSIKVYSLKDPNKVVR